MPVAIHVHCYMQPPSFHIVGLFRLGEIVSVLSLSESLLTDHGECVNFIRKYNVVRTSSYCRGWRSHDQDSKMTFAAATGSGQCWTYEEKI